MSGLVPGGTGVPGRLLQLRGQPPDPQTGDSLSPAEWDCSKQSCSTAPTCRQPVLHGQDVCQVRQGLQETLELREGPKQDDRGT